MFTLKFNERKSSSEHRCHLSTRNREILCYGCQSSASNWTQKANVIYWCSVGPRSPKPGEHTGPKTHKWDIDRFEGGEGKKVIFNHEVSHLLYRVVNILSLPLSLPQPLTHTLHSTAPWHSTVYVPMTTHQIAHWEQGWQHLKVLKWKEWSEL